MATARFSFTLGCPMNSDSFCGRSFNSKEESSSTWAADTRRSFRLGSALVDATGRIVAVLGCELPGEFSSRFSVKSDSQRWQMNGRQLENFSEFGEHPVAVVGVFDGKLGFVNGRIVVEINLGLIINQNDLG